MKTRLLIHSLLVGALFIFLTSCGGTSTGNPDSEDTSVSGAAVNSLGGALSGSSSSGTQASMFYKRKSFFETLVSTHFIPEAFAGALCPTFKTTGSGCTTAGGNMWLSYNDCFFLSSRTQWQGVQEIAVSSGTATCGSFPSAPASGFLYRQFVSSAGASSAGVVSVTTPLGKTVNIDDETLNLGNFESATITPIFNSSGYGSRVGFSGIGLRNSIEFGHREFVAGSFDHSIISNTISIALTSASTRTVSGTVTIYHNLMNIIGTADFSSGLTHVDSCCWPIAGTITTTFSAGTGAHTPTSEGANYVGKKEIMTLTGCGTATLESYDGTTQNVSLTRCF